MKDRFGKREVGKYLHRKKAEGLSSPTKRRFSRFGNRRGAGNYVSKWCKLDWKKTRGGRLGKTSAKQLLNYTSQISISSLGQPRGVWD